MIFKTVLEWLIIIMYRLGIHQLFPKDTTIKGKY